MKDGSILSFIKEAIMDPVQTPVVGSGMATNMKTPSKLYR
jgi:hypothetical protein